MQINSFNFTKNKQQSSPQSFTARRPDIRFADDIMRRANNEFPKFSPTRIYWNVMDKKRVTRDQQLSFIKSSFYLNALREELPDYALEPSLYTKMVLKMLKKYQLGNCGESGSLAKIALTANGIKDAKRVSLYGYRPSFPDAEKYKKLDHSFVIVNLAKDADLDNPLTYGKNAYVVDLWEGFVDTVQNAFKRFDIAYEDNSRMKHVEKKVIKLNDFEIDDETIKAIQQKYPNLKLKSQPKFSKEG